MFEPDLEQSNRAPIPAVSQPDAAKKRTISLIHTWTIPYVIDRESGVSHDFSYGWIDIEP